MTSYEGRVSQALPRPLAAVRETVRRAEIPSIIRERLGVVWSFLREHGVTSTGHNVGLYTYAGGSGPDVMMDVWFGVEVHEVIAPTDQVVETATPAGPVASTIHWGDYARLGEAHDAVQAWCRANGHRTAGTCWEVYGDWDDDWAKVRTDVFYLLEA